MCQNGYFGTGIVASATIDEWVEIETVLMKEMKDHQLALFARTSFLKRVSTKSRGSSTTMTNDKVMLFQTYTCDVINHAQC